MSSIFDIEMEDFNRVLAKYGHTNTSFQLTAQQDPHPASGALRPLTGHITVKHRETGVEHTYKVRHITAPWIAEFENHLKTNAFML